MKYIKTIRKIREKSRTKFNNRNLIHKKKNQKQNRKNQKIKRKSQKIKKKKKKTKDGLKNFSQNKYLNYKREYVKKILMKKKIFPKSIMKMKSNKRIQSRQEKMRIQQRIILKLKKRINKRKKQ